MVCKTFASWQRGAVRLTRTVAALTEKTKRTAKRSIHLRWHQRRILRTFTTLINWYLWAPSSKSVAFTHLCTWYAFAKLEAHGLIFYLTSSLTHLTSWASGTHNLTSDATTNQEEEVTIAVCSARSSPLLSSETSPVRNHFDWRKFWGRFGTNIFQHLSFDKRGGSGVKE